MVKVRFPSYGLSHDSHVPSYSVTVRVPTENAPFIDGLARSGPPCPTILRFTPLLRSHLLCQLHPPNHLCHYLISELTSDHAAEA